VSVLIRAPQAADEAAWRDLWAGYNRFYRAEVPETVTASLWNRLMQGGAEITGFLAELDGGVAGLAHTLLHPSTWSLRPSCYLEDLYVSPSARGAGIARVLIHVAAKAASDAGADRLYWHTQEYNAPARSLYDTLADRTSFIMYRKSL
jgi:GNAT superfamily N-acetyltransferase